MKLLKRSLSIIFVSTLLLFLLGDFSYSSMDEGMWTFDNPPSKILKAKYGFVPSKEWLDHVRLASVRFMDGGSGSFISPNGLVLTNHHVAMGQLQKISSGEKNYVTTGFLAKTKEEELKCPDLELNVLVFTQNVTERVRVAVEKGMSDAEALKARRAVIAKIEKESLDKTGLRSNVIDLYHGGEYWLYRYKKYTDVRLVMAPERQAAYFGGDSDNFTYPRYDLDMAFFRVYEKNQPIKSPHFLQWNSKGAQGGELVFVSGNPGSTDRLYTYAELEMARDFRYPLILEYIDKYLKALWEYAKKGQEQQRLSLGMIFGLENSKKAMTGEYNGLLEEELMAKRKKNEKEFLRTISEDQNLSKSFGNAWDIIEKVVKGNRKVALLQFYQNLRGYRLPGIATSIVRYVVEVKKPDAERLPGYHESGLNEFKFRLFSPAPVFKDMEEAVLSFTLQLSLDGLGKGDEFVKLVLAGRSPDEVAKEVIRGTKLDDPKFRKELIEGGQKAVINCKDPLIVLVRKIDPLLRKKEKWNRDNVESVIAQAREKIAKARFAAYGTDAYPDATFTLRLSYGTVKSYLYNGTRAPWKTSLYGVFDRASSFGNKGEYTLPQRFWDRKDELDLSTPVNFVSTCDIIGGNSGSPVINRKAEIVGLIFDGNIESLSGRFMYDEVKSRAVSVHTAYIIEGLRKLYDAGFIADEIEGKE